MDHWALTDFAVLRRNTGTRTGPNNFRELVWLRSNARGLKRLNQADNQISDTGNRAQPTKGIVVMIETALVFDKNGKTIHWHLPPGRNSGVIPDTRELWEILWENRAILGGVAHTHPWDGPAWYSRTDVTTFRAIDNALGQNLLWPVVTFTEVGYFQWHSSFQNPLDYGRHATAPIVLEDIEKLRELSR